MRDHPSDLFATHGPLRPGSEAIMALCSALALIACSREPDLGEQRVAAPNCVTDFDASRGTAEARKALAASDPRLMFLIQPGDDEGMRDVVPGISQCKFPRGTDGLRRLAGRVDLTDWRCSAKVYEYATAYNKSIVAAKADSVTKFCGAVVETDFAR